VDQLQNLVRENHEIQMFPYWSNASEFKSTNETFDTIALHHECLHNKLEEKCKELGQVKLTQEQKYLAKAMGTRLPFLPFVTKDEHRAYAQFVLEGKGEIDYNVASERWIEYVDGENVMPKLPSQLRTYNEAWSRNRRVAESVKNAKDGHDKLAELNKIISPHIGTEHIHEDTTWKAPQTPAPLPQPSVRAMSHLEYQIVGGFLVGNNPNDSIAVGTKRKRKCGVCRNEGCKGLGGRQYCNQFHKQEGVVAQNEKIRQQKLRQCQLCSVWGGRGVNCVIGSGDKKKCKYFHINGQPK
jgi:hypothetical protein